MQPDHWQRLGAEHSAAWGQIANKLPGSVLGIAVAALSVAEHDRILPDKLERERAARLPMRLEHNHGRRVDIDHTGLTGLGVRFYDARALTSDTHHAGRTPHTDRARLEVHVPPAQCECLASPHAGVGQDIPQRVTGPGSVPAGPPARVASIPAAVA